MNKNSIVTWLNEGKRTGNYKLDPIEGEYFKRKICHACGGPIERKPHPRKGYENLCNACYWDVRDENAARIREERSIPTGEQWRV